MLVVFQEAIQPLEAEVDLPCRLTTRCGKKVLYVVSLNSVDVMPVSFSATSQRLSIRSSDHAVPSNKKTVGTAWGNNGAFLGKQPWKWMK